jgi:hypothetical protein
MGINSVLTGRRDIFALAEIKETTSFKIRMLASPDNVQIQYMSMYSDVWRELILPEIQGSFEEMFQHYIITL